MIEYGGKIKKHQSMTKLRMELIVWILKGGCWRTLDCKSSLTSNKVAEISTIVVQPDRRAQQVLGLETD
jgi:hypothetical protein